MMQAYVRTTEGETRSLPLWTALRQWVSEEGYRVTIYLPDGIEVVMRRNVDEIPPRNELGELVVEANVTLRGV